MSLLDRGIAKSESDSDSDSDHETTNIISKTIKNPFFSRDKVIIEDGYVKLIDMKQKEFYYNFEKVYVICLKSNNKLEEYIYKDTLTINELELFTKQFDLHESNIKLLNNPVHRSQVILIDSYYLKLFNNQCEFKEKELVIPLFNITTDTYNLYAKQFTSHFTSKDYLAIKLVNEFYTNPYPNINYITEILKNLEPSTYWTKKFNTNLNMTNKFMNRGFNLSLNQRINDEKIKEVLNDINKMPREGDAYLNYIYRKAVYVDISSIIKRNGYSLYKINENIDITKSDITYLLKTMTSEYEFYNLTMSLLISKDYCHHVLNNPEYLHKLRNFNCTFTSNTINLLKKYPAAFQYAMGYSWLTLYMEECIKKTKITEDDRFVFTLNQAHSLPYFPFSSNITKSDQFRHNPYIPLLISDKILNLSTNTMGVEIKLNSNEMGVVNQETFQENFNIFLTSDKDINILDGVDMSNLGISGSVIPACITKYNPLMDLFPSKDRYYKEYYSTSDVDIMCNLENDFEYIDRINKFHKDISDRHIKLEHNNVELSADKIAALIINENFIKRNIVNSDISYEYILTNLDDEKVKLLFYKFYTEYKINENEKHIGSNKWNNHTYNLYFDIVPVDNIRIVFGRTKLDWKNYWDDINKKKTELEELNALSELEEIEKEYNYKSEDLVKDNEGDCHDNILFKCHENIKYRIKSSYLNHELEIFKIRWPSFFSTVSNFHLPCVRGYYDGKQTYLLPSCISAAMTLVNLDYKYFAGSKDPIEIINKYRQRGYSLALNDSEKIRLASYSVKVDKWNILYDKPNLKQKVDIDNIFGYISVNANFFKPRSILEEDFNKIKPVDLNYIDRCLTIDECNKYPDMMSLVYNTTSFKDIYKLCDLRIINNYGYVTQVKKWYFDAIYENS
jgi:hypothetical protein